MKPTGTRLALLAVAAVTAALVCLRLFTADAPVAPAASVAPQGSVPAVVPATPSIAAGATTTPARIDSRWLPMAERSSYALNWSGPLPPGLGAFRDWANRYLVARDPAARIRLESEGVSLAQARRAVMRRLIEHNPQRALASAVPAAVRQSLPLSILEQLEARLAGTGTYALYSEAVGPAGGASRRIITLGGVSYVAHAYGRRDAQLTKEGASLHGIALDGHMALHESPLRMLDAGEIPGRPISATTCPVSGQPVAPPAADAAVNVTDPTVVEVHGRLWMLASPDLLPALEQRLLEAERRPGPRVAPLLADGGPSQTSGPRVAELPATAWTTGAKRILVLRVDFTDVPGESVTAALAQALLDNEVRPFYEDSSYGAATLTSTVSPLVYRLPQSAATYATAGNTDQLHTDAKAAAAAAYTFSNYDVIMVTFPWVGTSAVAGSRFNWAGLGMIGGSQTWINGSFTFRVVAHELGHNYGLLHANLWKVTDGNPLSATGTSEEYGDVFDLMGFGQQSGNHFSAYAKNRLGWLPDSAVTTVTTSGTYRVYRFDHRNAPLNQPQALRVFRDGVRWYWVGLRQALSANASLTNGAYVIWARQSSAETDLLDLTTPGTATDDAALALNTTLTDSTSGVTLRPVARGGTAPSEYLDVEVTLQPPPRTVVAAWGGGAATDIPMELGDVRAIASGESHVLALKSDGTVAAWGGNLVGQSTVPDELTGVASVAAGWDVSGAVKSDGTVVLWGDAPGGVTTPPAGLNGVVQLAIGTTHALALKSDGTVVAWGYSGEGATVIPSGLANVVAVCAGDNHSVALKRDGTVKAWGGRIGLPPAGLSGIVAIAAGTWHVVALKGDGTVVSWGNLSSFSIPVDLPVGLSSVTAIGAGPWHSLAIKSDGTVVGWGENYYQQVSPIPPGLPRATAVAGGAKYSLALLYSLGPPFISIQPQASTIPVGAIATFSVVAGGKTPLAYQWQCRATGSTIWTNLAGGGGYSGAATATLAVSAATAAMNGDAFRCVVSNGVDPAATSIAVTLAVTAVPVITVQPQDSTVTHGQSASFASTAVGTAPLSYQWRKGGVAISSATNETFIIANCQSSDAGTYDVVVTNTAGTATSNIVRLTVIMPGPTITTQPVTQAVAPGGSVALSVAATGSGALTYQWARNGVPIVGATNASCTFRDAQLGNAGRYSVAVTDASGTTTSAPAQINLSGVLWAMGADGSGQLGVGSQKWRETPLPIASGVKAIAAGVHHSLFVKTDGTLWAMGSNSSGQLGDGTMIPRGSPVLVASGVVAAAVGTFHSMFLKSNGTLWAMGSNSDSQFGNGTSTDPSVPVQVAAEVSAMTAGYYHSLYLKTDGTLWAMGNNQYGQLGDGTTTMRRTPVQVASGVRAVESGPHHSFYLKTDATLWAAGLNTYGQLGDGTTTSRYTPVQVAVGVSAVSAGQMHSVYLKTDGSLWGMGYNSWGELGNGGLGCYLTTPVQVATGVSAMDAGGFHNLYLKSDGTLWAVGRNTYGQLGDGTTIQRESPIQVARNISAVGAGYDHSFFVDSGGTLWAMGDNSDAQLGDGRSVWRNSPVQVATDVGAVSAGNSHSLYLKGRGALWAVGDNSYGQAGESREYSGELPVFVASEVGAVSAGHYHSLYLKPDGTLWAMGDNSYGQLCDGTRITPSLPTQVASGVSAAVAGYHRSMYVKTDGTLWAAGDNWYGQLGDGTTVNRASPVQVASNVSAVALGFYHSLFLKIDGTLWAMGQNYNGELGDGTTSNRSVPVQVAADVNAMAAGRGHSLFLKTNGTLWVMGANSVGQLGDGTLTSRRLPVQIASSVIVVAAGHHHSLFLKTDGTQWAMGDNSKGQLGGGTTISHSTPVQVASSVFGVAAGDDSSFFIQAAGVGEMPTVTTQPVGASYPAGASATMTVAASGSGPIDYRWRKGGIEILGARSATFTIPLLQMSDADNYDVVVTNSAGSVTSNAAPLAVTQAPAFTSANSAAFVLGVTGTFTVVASGSPAPTFSVTSGTFPSWASLNTATGIISGTPPNAMGSPFVFTLSASNGIGSAATQSFTLTVNFAPTISTPPASVTVIQGQPASFSVLAGGSPLPTYQWRKGGNNLPAATNATLELATTQPSDLGNYDVVVSNSVGSVISSTATLTVNVPPAITTGASLPNGTVGQVYSFTVVATGTPAPTFSATGLPAGLSINGGSGVLSGTPTNAGSFASVITASNGVNPNAVQNATLTIGKATQSIAFTAPASKTYGDAAFAVSATATSRLPVSVAVASGPATIANGTVTLTGAGTVTLRASQPGDGNYTVAANVERSFTVAKATLTATADAKTRTYGAANPAFTMSYAGFVNSETAAVLTTAPVGSTTATVGSPAGSYAIAVSGGGATNYAFTYVGGMLTVAKAPLTVTADAKTRIYGAANPAFTATLSGFVNGESLVASGVTGGAAFSTNANAASGGNTYAIAPTLGTLAAVNYAFATFTPGTLTVTKAPLTAKADDKSRAFGVSNPGLTISYTGFVNGDTAAVIDSPPTATTAATMASPAGDYAITLSGGSDDNYALTLQDGMLSVGKTSQAITFAALANKTYGDGALAVSATATSGLPVSIGVASGPATIANGTATLTGAGTVVLRASQAGDGNYSPATNVERSFTVTKAPLTVTAEGKSRGYGAANPAMTVVYAGWMNGDTASSLNTAPVAATIAGPTASVGAYTITPSGGTSANYAFTYVNGSLTITKAALTATAEAKTRAYGAANPAFTVSYAGFVNGETAAVLTVAPAATTNATLGSNTGTYTIEPAGGAAANYAFTYVNGALTVTKAPLSVKADDLGRAFGVANPVLTISYTGFVNGDTVAVIDTSPTAATTATLASPAGSYPITLTGGSDNNYALALVAGTLTVSQQLVPIIPIQPADREVIIGGSATFTVAATNPGAGFLAYRWYFTPAGSATPQALSDQTGKLAGTQTATLTVSNVQTSDTGDYVCVVSNGNGHTTSNAAKLSIILRTVRVVSQTAAPGAQVVVPIQLLSAGDENTVTFGLQFNPAKLSYVSHTAGADVAGGTITLNVSQKDTGQLGFLVGKAPDTVHAAGTRTLLTLTFTVAAGVAGDEVVPLTFADQPNSRRIFAVAGAQLPGAFADGRVTATSGLEGDINGDGEIDGGDWVKLGRMIVGLDPSPASGVAFMRADIAPRTTKGDGTVDGGDWVQLGRYVVGLDAVQPAGGPSAPIP